MKVNQITISVIMKYLDWADKDVLANREFLRKDAELMFEIEQIKSSGPNWKEVLAAGAAGGEEATNWGQELLRMYSRYAQMKGFKVEALDVDVIKIEGRGAFELLKYFIPIFKEQK